MADKTTYIGITINGKDHLVLADDRLCYSDVVKLARGEGVHPHDLTIAYSSPSKDGSLWHGGPCVKPESMMHFAVADTSNA